MEDDSQGSEGDNSPQPIEDDNSSTSSIDSVYNRLKDKSTPELEGYYEAKQRRLDETKDTDIAANRRIRSASEPVTDEALGGEYNYRDDNILGIHKERSRDLADQKEIVAEMRDIYKESKEETQLAQSSTGSKRSRDEVDNEIDNSKKQKVTSDIASDNDTSPKSNVDFVLEKQLLELPSIIDSDGGGD